MKKILAVILCFAMVFTTMGLPAFAEPATDGRLIEVTAAPETVFADDEVTVTVKIHGEELADAVWTLTYIPAHFTLKEYSENGVIHYFNETAGTIQGNHFITDGSTYTDGYTLATYVFIAQPQSAVTPSTFTLSETYAYTYMEAMTPTQISTPNNGAAEVTIDLREYDVDHFLDDKHQVDENGNDATEATIPYDDVEHRFSVKAYLKDGKTEDTAAKVQYRLADDEAQTIALLAAEEEYEWFDSIDDLKAEGEHLVAYRITPSIGYAPKDGLFKVNIIKPVYELEVDTEKGLVHDYVAGKKIVLVYTHTDNVYFTYNNYMMLDVTANYSEFDGETYEHVYAFVTDAIDAAELEHYDKPLDAYKANIGTAYGTDAAKACKTVIYSTDLNGFGGTDIRDVTVGYGVLNAYEGYFDADTYQEQILRADLNKDKRVTSEDDITFVVGDAFEA